MQVGNGMPVNQERAHFTMWAMLAAPLISGNDLRNMSSETLNVLTNKEVIEINQDTLGIQGYKYAVKDSVETWLKPLKNNEWALVYLNRSKSQKSISVDWKNFRVNDEFSGRLFDTTTKDIFIVRDLWLKKVIGDTRKTLQATISGEDVLCLKISKKPVKKQK